jgi:ketosteroid isomerase-like protein
MSQEDVELTRRVFDALRRRDLDEFVALHDPSCEIQPLLAAVAGDYHGHDGVREWLDDLFGAFPDFSIRLDEVRELGDRTLGAARIRAHGAHGMDSAGPMIDQVTWVPAEIRNGRVIWWGNFRTEPEALEAVGLRE